MLSRAPALAGLFYAADPGLLSKNTREQFNQAQEIVNTRLSPRSHAPKILILPHAGHMYSGLVASIGFMRIAPYTKDIKRIVMLCPAHREYFAGVALPDVDSFTTPLGMVRVDHVGAACALDLPYVQINAQAHALEHALEVQLPFVQELWRGCPLDAQPTIVPIVVGDIDANQLTNLMDRLWGNPGTLILISTDLSHFQGYEQAKITDGKTCNQIINLQMDITHAQACGATPLNAALKCARERELEIEQLAYCTSGDTAGNSLEGRQQVVGYASFALYESPENVGSQEYCALELPMLERRRFLDLARASLHQAVGADLLPLPERTAHLDARGACFITLHQDNQLRGCIGSLSAYRSLMDEIIGNTHAAALQDSRFTPVTASEVSGIEIKISLIANQQKLYFESEAHALWQLEPQRDGVIFYCQIDGREHRGTFLPQVWEQISDAGQFMAQLKIKAGLAANFWSADIELHTYRVLKFSEAQP